MKMKTGMGAETVPRTSIENSQKNEVIGRPAQYGFGGNTCGATLKS